MKVTSLRLKGIGRFDDAELPVDRLTEDDRLVAIVGGNGEGKSTMLGCVPGAAYHHMPGYGPINQMATTRNSAIELGLDVGTQAMIIKLLVNADARPVRQEAYISVDGEAVNPTGKVTEFRKKIAELLPPKDLYLASNFAAQDGEGRFLELPQAGRKELFARMLGLERLQKLAKSAADRAKDLRDIIKGKSAAVEAIRDGAGDPLALNGCRANATMEGAAAAERVKELEAQRTKQEEALRVWAKEMEQLTLAEASAKADIDRAEDSAFASRNELKRLDDRLAKIVSDRTDSNRFRKEQDQLQGKIVMSFPLEIPELKDRIKVARELKDADELAYREWRATRDRLGRELDKLKARDAIEQVKAGRDLADAERELSTTKARAKIVDEVTCSGVTYDSCPLLASAREADENIAELINSRDIAWHANGRYENKSTGVLRTENELAQMPSEPQLPDRDIELHAKELELAEKAEAAAHGVRVRLAILSERIEALEKSVDGLAGAGADVDVAKRDVGVAQERISIEMERRTDAADAVKRHYGNEPLPVASIPLDEARRAESRATAAVATITAELARAEKDQVRIQALGTELTGLASQLDDWTELARVLGVDGVQALLIDAAGPEVSTIANELLSECYGDRFAVRLVTTAPMASGKGSKEVFDLTVLDNDRAREGAAEKFSGGEKKILNEAISLAIAIFNGRKGGIQGGDIFRDECTGALDESTAPRYVGMLRKALDIGGFGRCYFITHQAELVDLADAVFRFEGGECY